MEQILVEKTASRGIAAAKVYKYQEPDLTPDTYTIAEEETAKEQKKFACAKEAVIHELEKLASENEIFAAHLEIAGDFTLQEGVDAKIAEGKNAQAAVQETIEEFAAIFSAMDDAYMKERGADILDIGKRFMAELKGILSKVEDGMFVCMDAGEGVIVIDPDEEKVSEFAEKKAAFEQERKYLEELRNKPAVTKDGKQIYLCANVGNAEDIKKALPMNIDGVGLFRSEFLYMENTHFPTEEEQYRVYKEAAELCPQELTVRTLDIGGDKELSYFDFEKEENPFLGWRAIRISLDMKEMFKEQLRAILRASAYGHVRIMFPMIISLEELREAKDLVEECKQELKEAGVAFDPEIETGMMIETPASVLLAEEFAKEADFFSIGTNDLTQYLLAVDRGNKKIADRYSYFHPAVLKAIGHVIDAGHKEGIKVGMCGEMAGDEKATAILLEMGLDEFSMSAGSMDYVRKQIEDIKISGGK